jgi:N-acetylneuraminate synthase
LQEKNSRLSPLVIAEIGINHEGSLGIAKEMVDAYRASVEVVKHQTHIVEDDGSRRVAPSNPGNADISIYEIMERCSLNESDELPEGICREGNDFLFQRRFQSGGK